MKRSNWIVSTALAVGFTCMAAGATATALSAQPHTATLRAGQYDKATEVVVNGTIQSIQFQSGSDTLPRGTYLELLSPPLTLNVQMGLFSAASIPFKAGASVSVTGSLMTVNGAQVLLARQVQSSSQSVKVRSSRGFVLRPLPNGQAGAHTLVGGLQ